MRSLGILAVLSIGALDCDALDRPDAAAEGAPASAVAAAAEVPGPSGPTEPTAAMPGPARARGDEAVRLNATCVGCHAKEAAEWRSSRHRRADTNAAYRAALAIEPSSFCQSCHAPEADPEEKPSPAESDLGVGCVTCHVAEPDAVLAPPRDRPGDGAPHPVVTSRAFADTGACAGCHEFRFPGARGDAEALLMQATVREHGVSEASSTACASCHMPRVDGHRSHAFSASRDPSWLRANLDASADVTDGGVRVTLAQPAPGHAFPTGDLFRRLEVGCEVRAPGGAVVARATRHLARHFQRVAGQSRRELTRDDRVRDEPVVVDLAAAIPAGGRARWWVSYQRVATTGDGADDTAAVIESEVLLHGGELTKP